MTLFGEYLTDINAPHVQHLPDRHPLRLVFTDDANEIAALLTSP